MKFLIILNTNGQSILCECILNTNLVRYLVEGRDSKPQHSLGTYREFGEVSSLAVNTSDSANTGSLFHISSSINTYVDLPKTLFSSYSAYRLKIYFKGNRQWYCILEQFDKMLISFLNTLHIL